MKPFSWFPGGKICPLKVQDRYGNDGHVEREPMMKGNEEQGEAEPRSVKCGMQINPKYNMKNGWLGPIHVERRDQFPA